jgi:nitroreductase
MGSSAPADVAIGEDTPVFEVMRTMRAMRRLKPDAVPRELLERLIEAATWGPSASNTQTYSWVIVTDREQMRRLADPWLSCMRFYERIAVRADSMTAEQYRRLMDAVTYQAEHFADTPALLVACYDMGDWHGRVQRNVLGMLRGMRHVGIRRAVKILLRSHHTATMSEAASVYPSVQNVLLAARALGLGAVLTTWHLMLEDEFKEILGIPKRVKTFALIPVGWPKGKFGPVVRRPAAEAIRHDRW